MLNFVRRWWINRQRAIFRYWDGSRFRNADPWALYRALQLHNRFTWEHLKLVEIEDAEAIEITLEAVRDVFGVQAFDGETRRGLTESETIALIESFEDYVAIVKKKVSHSPTWPESTEPDPSDESITKPASDFTSTFREPNCGEPITL